MRAISGRNRAATVAVAAALVAVVAVKYLSEARGSAGARVLELFDARVPFEHRVSTRPVLWESAITLFSRRPVAGTGLGAFSWQLPNLLAETGQSIGATDNPGNAYLQALAETGLLGFVLTVAFLGVVAAESWSSLRDPDAPVLAAAAGAAALAFLAALLTGSHWLSPDVAFTFFLTAAVVSRRSPSPPRRGARTFSGVVLAAYAVAAVVSAAATSRAAEAFRYRPEMGFYAPETGPGGSYRWTRKRFAVRLAAGETARLELVHFTPESESVRLEARAWGLPVDQRSLAPGEAVRLRLQASADAPTVFRFALSRAFVPRQLGASRDGRELGVMALAEPGR